MTRTANSDVRIFARQIISISLCFVLVNTTLWSAWPFRKRTPSKVSNPQTPVRRRTSGTSASSPTSRPVAPIAPQVAATPIGQSETLLPDGRTLLMGGVSLNNFNANISLRNPGNSTVTPVPAALRHPRAFHTATLLPDGTILVLGGLDAGGLVAEPEILDPASFTSVALPKSLLRARAYHTATVLTDGFVLVAGGVAADGHVVNEAELWNPRNGVLEALPTLLSPRRRHTASLLADGSVALWGGADQTGPLVAGERFEPVTKSFGAISSISGDPEGQTQIAASLPADGSNSVDVGSTIALRFSKPIAAESANSTTITLTNSERNVPVKIVPAELGRLVFITPEGALQPGTNYSLSVQGVADQTGAPVANARIAFTTAGVISGAPGLRPNATANAFDPNDPESEPVLQAAAGVTALSGRVWTTQNYQPISGVTLETNCSGQKKSVQSDSSGLFLIENITSGHCVLEIDGSSAGNGGRQYGKYFVGVEVGANQTNALDYIIWMTPLDKGNAAAIPSPTTQETVISTPLIKGLELHLPPGATVTDYDGTVIKELSITTVPLNQPPFPLPAVNVVFYFTIQPGGAYIKTADGSGAGLFYPNKYKSAPGTKYNFWNYDPDGKGWYIYGKGTVSADARQVIPDPGVTIYRLTGAMTEQPLGPPPGPPSCSAGCDPTGAPPAPGTPPPTTEGDPVEESTGLFLHNKTDLTLPDVIPLTLTRSYRQGDSVSRSFGVGTNLSYDMFLVGDRFPYTYIDLILADSSRVHFLRTSGHTNPSTDYLDAVMVNNTTPGPYFGAVITWDSSIGWSLRKKDGTIMKFPAADLAAPANYRLGALKILQDRFGNSVTLNRSGCTVPTGFCVLTQITSPNGRWIKFSYDSKNRITSAQDNIGRTVRYNYDAAGHLTKVTDAGGGSTQYTYDSNDQVLTVTDPRGIAWVNNTYDSNGRVHIQALGTGGEGGQYVFDYTTDAGGNITQTQVTDPNNNVKTVSFNTATSYSSGGYPSVMLYQATGNQPGYQYYTGTNLLQSETDSFGRTTNYVYDAVGNLTSVSQTPSGVSTTYTWDPAYNQLKTVTVTGGSISRTTTFNYASGLYLQSIVAPSGTTNVTMNPNGTIASASNPLGSVSFTYTGSDVTQITSSAAGTITRVVDGAGRVTSSTDALANTAYFDYDRLNNLLAITDPAKGTTQFSYDGNGNLLNVKDAAHPSTPTTYSYDSMDRVKTRTDPLLKQETYTYFANGNPHTFTDRKSQTTTLTYDTLNRLTQSLFQDGSTVGYHYDPTHGWLDQINDSLSGVITRGYDSLDLLTSEQTPQGTIAYTNDSFGRRSSMTAPGQSAINYCYDNADRLTEMRNDVCGSNTTPLVTLAYDTAGRRSTLTVSNGIVTTYGYDPTTSRLTSINYDRSGTHVGDLSYGYDTIGRRTSMGGTLARVTLPAATSGIPAYNVNNQLTGWNGSTLSYDLNGNMTSDGVRSYTWSARNQLTAIGSTTFQYDALGRRSRNGAGVSFVYDGLNSVQEIVGGSARANLLTGGLDEIFTRTDSGGTSSFITDALGSTLALADSTGTVQTQYAFDPFGSTTSTGASSTNAFEYTGRENDGSGMYYYRARYYNSALQRFVSEDPMDLSAGNTNYYAYVFNNPINLHDPSGTLAVGALIGGVIGGITGAIGARLQGGSTGDVVFGALTGAAAGAALGLLDPTEGVLTVGRYALLGGAAAFVGDVFGQGFGNRSRTCKSFNFGEAIGAGIGGGVGTGMGAIFAGAVASVGGSAVAQGLMGGGIGAAASTIGGPTGQAIGPDLRTSGRYPRNSNTCN